jgi:hypothetical protein
MNVFEQLKAEYEATLLDGTWETLGEQAYDEESDYGETGVVVYPEPDKRYVYVEICTTDCWEDADNEAPANMAWIASAHERGYPLLMAVFEAAAEYVAAKDALAEADGGDSEASFRASLEHRSRCDLALRAALAPLLAEAE